MGKYTNNYKKLSERGVIPCMFFFVSFFLFFCVFLRGGMGGMLTHRNNPWLIEAKTDLLLGCWGSQVG